MPRILVIDDDHMLRLTVKTMLESDGHEVTLAVDGEDGLRKFEKSAFDLVVCDVFMPNVEGMETIRRIRRMSSRTPIISMTGIASPTGEGAGDDPDFLRMTAALGATKTIAKPFGRDQLLSLVWRSLGPGATRSAS
ncbi:MAG TPA: response regulator [Candidatus Binatia bacterium]|nr:response regulator [Candidatus Binatia bacterium]